MYNKLGEKADEFIEKEIKTNKEKNIEINSRDSRNRLKELDNSSFSYDNQGRKLSKEQQEYFKDCKVRDENGNLVPVIIEQQKKYIFLFNKI